MTYDAAGDVTYDGAHAYTYDAEGRIATVPSFGTTYVYDAEGRRVAMYASSGSSSCGTPPRKTYYYDLSDHLVSEQCPGGRVREEYYENGRHLITFSGSIFYDHPNWLATEQYRSNMTGGLFGVCVNNPFGDDMTCAETEYSPVHFSGKERDWSNSLSPTNLDNFGARCYSSNIARFMTPDPDNDGAAADDPQSWNAYTYGRNDPVTNIDPDGRACVSTDGGNTYHDDGSGGESRVP